MCLHINKHTQTHLKPNLLFHGSCCSKMNILAQVFTMCYISQLPDVFCLLCNEVPLSFSVTFILPLSCPDNRMIKVNGTREPLEFKSHQWFGATVRTHKGKVVVSDAQKHNPVKVHLQSSSRWTHASVHSWMRLETLLFISK